METRPSCSNTFQFMQLNSSDPVDARAAKLCLAKKLRTHQSVLSGVKFPENGDPNQAGRLPNTDDMREAFRQRALAEAKMSRHRLGCQKSIRKVNMDFFRGKRVLFKHSQVRISFEIVDTLNN